MIAIGIIISVISIVCILSSKKNFDELIKQLSYTHDSCICIESAELKNEIARSNNLPKQVQAAKNNLNKASNGGILVIPKAPDFRENFQTDDILKEINCFCNESLKQVGAEQVILRILSPDQISKSLSAVHELLPQNLSDEIFGNAISTLRDGITSLGTMESLKKFLYGMSHLSNGEVYSIAQSLQHHNLISPVWTLLKSGTVEAIGLHDATTQIVSSLQNVGNELKSALSNIDDYADELTSDFSEMDGSSIHFPIITLAISSYRELNLLSDEKTNIINSLKNTALDITGTAGGGAIGAKAGAAIGGIGGPLGAVIGAGIGGIIGALAGRSITNKIKLKPLNDAITLYNREYERMLKETWEKSKSALINIKNKTNEETILFKKSLSEEIPVIYQQDALKPIAINIYNYFFDELESIRTKCYKVRNSIWYKKKQSTLLGCVQNDIDNITQLLPSEELISTNPLLAIENMLKIKFPNGIFSNNGQQTIKKCQMELNQINNKNDAWIIMWSCHIYNLYQDAILNISQFASTEIENLNYFFINWKNYKDTLENSVITEMQKLGIDKNKSNGCLIALIITLTSFIGMAFVLP